MRTVSKELMKMLPGITTKNKFPLFPMHEGGDVLDTRKSYAISGRTA